MLHIPDDIVATDNATYDIRAQAQPSAQMILQKLGPSIRSANTASSSYGSEYLSLSDIRARYGNNFLAGEVHGRTHEGISVE